MKQIVFKISCIVVCVSVMLSVFIFPVSAIDEGAPSEVSLNLEGFPYNDTDVTFFANGVYLLADTYEPIYFEMWSTDTRGRVGTVALPGFYFFEKPNGSAYDIMFSPYVYYTQNTDTSADVKFKFYDKNGNNVFSSAGGLTSLGQYNAIGGNLSYPGFDAPVDFYGDYRNYVSGYPYVSSFTKSSGMFYLISSTMPLKFPEPGNTIRLSSLYEYPFALNIPMLNDSRPTLKINGDIYYEEGSGSRDTVLQVVGNIEPVTDENGNVTNYIINNEIDISPIIDVSPSSPLDVDGMNEFESAIGEVRSTIPEEDLSNMMGNVDMSGRPIEWIYQQLEDFVSGNNKVFSVYMAILSMSFIMFVLNKGSSVRGG